MHIGAKAPCPKFNFFTFVNKGSRGSSIQFVRVQYVFTRPRRQVSRKKDMLPLAKRAFTSRVYS
jgi:hypothetical protein